MVKKSDDKDMPVKMPTGDEAPAGYEKIYAAYGAVPQQGEIRIDCVMVSQLAESEKAELQNVRVRSQDYFLELTGVESTRETVEDWLTFSIKGHTRSDQMIVRAYSGKYLTGYCHVLCGLFDNSEWTILYVSIDPSFRLQGIGTKLIAKVEAYAKRSGVTAVNYAAVPTTESETSFWGNAGYTDEVNRFEWTIGKIPREVIIYRKQIEQ